jgi:hypothetical protein
MESKFIKPIIPKPALAWKPKKVGVIQPSKFVNAVPITVEEFIPKDEPTRWYSGGN